MLTAISHEVESFSSGTLGRSIEEMRTNLHWSGATSPDIAFDDRHGRIARSPTVAGGRCRPGDRQPSAANQDGRAAAYPTTRHRAPDGRRRRRAPPRDGRHRHPGVPPRRLFCCITAATRSARTSRSTRRSCSAWCASCSSFDSVDSRPLPRSQTERVRVRLHSGLRSGLHVPWGRAPRRTSFETPDALEAAMSRSHRPLVRPAPNRGHTRTLTRVPITGSRTDRGPRSNSAWIDAANCWVIAPAESEVWASQARTTRGRRRDDR